MKVKQLLQCVRYYTAKTVHILSDIMLVLIGSFSAPHFSVVGLNVKIYKQLSEAYLEPY